MDWKFISIFRNKETMELSRLTLSLTIPCVLLLTTRRMSQRRKDVPWIHRNVWFGSSSVVAPNRLALVNRCRRLYWNYLWNHPVHASLSARALEAASDALLWFYVRPSSESLIISDSSS